MADLPFSLADATRSVEGFLEDEPGLPGGAFQYAIELRDAPGLIGDLMLRNGEDPRLAEVGFTIAPDHRRRGYASRRGTLRCTHHGVHAVLARDWPPPAPVGWRP